MEFFKWMHFSFVGLTLTLQGEKKIKKWGGVISHICNVRTSSFILFNQKIDERPALLHLIIE
jgi:hypothetical protein